FVFFFFFSSRRRHTRFKCDWSSDVCSSDLTIATIDYELCDERGVCIDSSRTTGPLAYLHGRGVLVPGLEDALEGRSPGERFQIEIGRASCRERVWGAVEADGQESKNGMART